MADLRFFVTQEGTLNQGGSGNDTVFNYTGLFSSNTVKGSDGTDLISFANQTNAVQIHARHTAGSAGSFTAGLLVAEYSGANVSAGTIQTTKVFTTALSAAESGAVADVTGSVVALQQTGIQTLRKVVVGGNTGNDSIYLGDQITEFSGNFIGGGQGNDLLGTFNSAGVNDGKINASFSASTLAGGLGKDTVFVNLSAGEGAGFKVAGNGGADSVRLSATFAELSTGLVGGGKGEDTVFVIGSTGDELTVRGGNGNDVVDVNLSAGGFEMEIAGDGTETGADTIRVALGNLWSSNTIDGGDGNDSIVLSGTTAADGGSNLYLGGTGADTILFQSAGEGYLSSSTIKGGMGADSILISYESAGAAVSSIVYGNKGDDTITFAAPTALSAGSNNLTIQGGAGADLLTNSGFNTAGGTGVFTFKDYSDSTLDAADTILFSTAAVSAGASTTFALTQVRMNIATGSVSLASGAGVSGAVSASGGFVVFSGYSDNNLTARVSSIDASYTTTGAAAVFTTDNAARYLFVQGGSTDLVAKLASADNLSAGQANLVLSGNIIGFGAG